MGTSEKQCTYSIDARDRIADVDQAWEAFARENGTPELTREAVVGRSIWDFVTGSETRETYESLFEWVRHHDARVMLPFRCDSPRQRRSMMLELSPSLLYGVNFVSRLLDETSQSVVPVLDALATHAIDRVAMCSFCKKLRVTDEWLEPLEALTRLEMLDRTEAPRIDYCVCSGCLHIARQHYDGDGLHSE